MGLLVTDRELERVFVGDLEPDGVRQVVDDAGRVYSYVRRNEWLDEGELRRYGERNGIGPDRMNRALRLLRETGKLSLVPLDAETAAQQGLRAPAVEDAPLEEVRRRARELGVKDRSKLGEAALRQAVANAEAAAASVVEPWLGDGDAARGGRDE